MDNYIFELENCVSHEFCHGVIEKYENDDRKKPGRMTVGVDKSIKDSTDLSANQYEEWKPVCHHIGAQIISGLTLYIEHLSKNGINKCNIMESIFNNAHIGYPNLQRTSKGGFYDWHVDMDRQGNRLMTYILYLNDVEEGYGGTTDFSCGKSILPKEGKLILFPSTWAHIHTGKKLEKGFKYIATGYISKQGP
jgi:hypothetical protein|tara:strand:- start:83 stop:661 length:579 start_codon:yes stop_codon:yes gene_type:complete